MKDVTCLVKSGTFPKYWIQVRGNLFVQVVIRTGRYLYRSLSVQVVSSQTQIMHQRLTGDLHSILLNYEAQLCYYKDNIRSLNS